jgi:hypothetical protein
MKLPLVVSAVLIAFMPAAWAVESVSPLPPGKPAGLHRAQFDDGGNGMLLVAGLSLVGIAIALATTSNNVAQAPGTTPTAPGTTSSTGTNP